MLFLSNYMAMKMGINLLHLALDAAMVASREIMNIYNDPSSDFGIERQADNSPLTRADVAAHRAIAEVLGCSGVPILSEEGRAIPFEERREWRELWVVDPIDGTKEFIKRNGEFTVNIAYVVEGLPVMGVIFAPATEELYFGTSELGAFKAMVSDLSVTAQEVIKQAVVIDRDAVPQQYSVVASRSHLNAETEAFINEQTASRGEVVTISRGSSLKICLVAEGKASVYPRYAPTMEWDTAAGDAILRSLGEGCALVEAESGETLRYNKESLLNPYFITRK